MFKKLVAITSFVAIFVGLVPMQAHAADPLVCTLAVSATAASTGGNIACTWPKASNIMIQCDVDVYVDSTTVGVTAPTATTSGQKVEFTKGVNDPLPIWLGQNDREISVRTVTGSGTCSFFSTLRKRPY